MKTLAASIISRAPAVLKFSDYRRPSGFVDFQLTQSAGLALLCTKRRFEGLRRNSDRTEGKLILGAQ